MVGERGLLDPTVFSILTTGGEGGGGGGGGQGSYLEAINEDPTRRQSREWLGVEGARVVSIHPLKALRV